MEEGDLDPSVRGLSILAKVDVTNLSTGELLRLSRKVLAELREREVIRTGNAPTGDYAEWLVQKSVGGKLEPNSNSSWDLETPDGEHLQIKARVVVNPRDSGQRQLSPFRSWNFDAAVVVLFDDEFKVRRAARLTPKELQKCARYSKHVNGEVVLAKDEMLDSGEDWTERLRKASRRQAKRTR